MSLHEKPITTTQFGWVAMIKSILFLLDTYKKQYLFHNAILLAILFYDLLPVFIIGKVVDFFTQYKPGMSLLPFYLYCLFLAVSYGIVSFIRLATKYTLGKIQAEATYFTRVKGFERLLDFSIKWHDKENTGNKVQRIQNGTHALGDLQFFLSNSLFPQLTNITGVLIAFLLLKPLFFVYCLIYVGIFIVIQASFYRRMQEMTDEYNMLSEKASGIYYEGLSNVLTIKTLGVKNDFKKNITSREELSRDHSIAMQKFGTDKWKAFQIVNALSLGGIALLSGQGFLVGSVTVGSIFIFFNYFTKLSFSVGECTNQFDRLMQYKVSIARMMPIFWEKSTARQGNRLFPKDWDDISVKNAHFSYQQTSEGKEREQVALRDITFAVKRFEKIGIVGASGSGKSTFAKMLLGLYTFDRGSYHIGATDFYALAHDQVTQHIALVLQESEMFNLSLKENITLMRKFDNTLFMKAIAIAQLENLIQNLPDGVDTLIGEKGYRLSGGERQRIGIARAIYKDPQILVLDEATSSLDTKTESLIQDAFEKELEKKTIISIAHRVSTLTNVDKIFVFDKGAIVEEGTFHYLAKDRTSHFSALYQQQRKKV